MLDVSLMKTNSVQTHYWDVLFPAATNNIEVKHDKINNTSLKLYGTFSDFKVPQ